MDIIYRTCEESLEDFKFQNNIITSKEKFQNN